MNPSRRSLLKAAAAAPILFAPSRLLAQAADYPSKPITSIAMFAPGTGADIIVRFYAKQLQDAIDNPVVVENKVGMGGGIAAGYVAHAKPDGYTIFMSSSSALAAAPSLFKTLPYDPLKDFAHVTTVFKAAFVLVVPSASPFRTMSDLTEHLRKKGSKGSYGSATQPGKVASEIYKQQMGLETVEVPYKSGIDAINDLLAGQIDFYCTDSGTVRSQINPGGRLRALMTTSEQPLEALPQIPSATKAGVKMNLIAYWPLLVPAGTPAPVVDKLARWMAPIVASDEAKTFLANLGYDRWIGDRGSVGEMMQREAKAWADYVKLARIEPQ